MKTTYVPRHSFNFLVLVNVVTVCMAKFTEIIGTNLTYSISEHTMIKYIYSSKKCNFIFYDNSNNIAVLPGESKACHALSLLKPKKVFCVVFRQVLYNSTTLEALRVLVMENYFILMTCTSVCCIFLRELFS